MRNRLPINNFLMVTHHHTDGQYPRCHSLEMTIHILRDCPWAKEAWAQPQASYPWPSSTCLYKNGSNVMLLGLQLFCPINFHGEFISLSFAGIYG